MEWPGNSTCHSYFSSLYRIYTYKNNSPPDVSLLSGGLLFFVLYKQDIILIFTVRM